MSFDEFVLGNATVVDTSTALEAVRIELMLGPEFVEPKVFIGLDAQGVHHLREVLNSAYARLTEAVHSGGYMQSASEVEHLVNDLSSNEAYFVQCEAISGAALYELAMALDRFRAAGEAVPFLLAADSFAPSSSLAHPLWTDEQMSQPLGVLDFYVIAPSTPP